MKLLPFGHFYCKVQEDWLKQNLDFVKLIVVPKICMVIIDCSYNKILYGYHNKRLHMHTYKKLTYFLIMQTISYCMAGLDFYKSQ